MSGLTDWRGGALLLATLRRVQSMATVKDGIYLHYLAAAKAREPDPRKCI